MEKWQIENNKLPKNLRRPTPVKPMEYNIGASGSYDIQAMNDAAWEASKAQLLECENCGRRFQPDRLQVHQRSCKPGNTAKRVGQSNLNQNSYNDNVSTPPQPQTRQKQSGFGGGYSNGGGGGSRFDDAPIGKQGRPQQSVDDSGVPLNLVPCQNCGRNFAADRIQKHIQACSSQKKRKVFDVTKMRVQGTDAASFVLTKKGRQAQQAPPKAPKTNWRNKHEEFINAIRYAKMAGKIEKEGGSLANLPPPPRSENPDYVQCPYCMRRFNQVAAERHM